MKQNRSLILVAASIAFSLVVMSCDNPTNSAGEINHAVNDNDEIIQNGGDTSAVAFTVTYNANGYTENPAPEDTTAYSDGDTAILLRMDTMAYNLYGEDGETSIGVNHFVGWNTLSDGNGTTYHPDRSLTITSDVTLYARWAQDSIQRLRFDVPGSLVWPYPHDGNQYLTGDIVPLPAGDIVQAPEGHEFVRWNNFHSDDHFDAGDLFTVTNTTQRNSFLAGFRKLSYTLTVDLQGGSWPAEDLGNEFTVEYGTTLSVPVPVDPVMTSADFQSWEMYFPEDDGDYWDIILLNSITMPARNVEIRAVFQPFAVF